MNAPSVSGALTVYSAPLISFEKSPLLEKVFSVWTRVFQWVRSRLTRIFPLKKENVEPLPKRDIQLAQRTFQISETAKPNPLRFLKNSFLQGIFPAILSWYQQSHHPISSFVAKRTVDATSAGFVTIANAFFPAYSDGAKRAVALTICSPIIWTTANRLGYRQGYLFFLGIAYNVCTLSYQVFGHYKERKQREVERLTFSTQAG